MTRADTTSACPRSSSPVFATAAARSSAGCSPSTTRAAGSVALSAGTQPGEHIHPEVVDALEKLGLDTSREHPTLLTRETIAASDLAVTLGCGEECPYVPGVRYVDWPVDDPGGQDEATVRRIVADLDTRVRDLLRRAGARDRAVSVGARPGVA